MNAKLIIGRPKLVISKRVARVCCDIIENRPSQKPVKKQVTFDVDKKWRKYLVTENVNAYLIACLPYAMRNQMDIELLAPVSSDLLHNIEMYLIPHLVKYDSRLFPTKIHASNITTKHLKNAGAVGTGMSMGVDSFFTVHKYIAPKYKDFKLTHLLVEQVGDLADGGKSERYKRNVNERTVNDVAKALSLPVVHTYSNLRQEFKVNHYHTHTYLAMFNVHMMAKLFRTYFYSSAEDFSHFSLIDNSTHDAASYELLSLQALSTDTLNLLSGGASSDRIEKTKELAESEVARNFLRVCLKNELNCGVCKKCRRTLLTLDMLGTLDKFKAVFDVSTYKKHKEEHLCWLIRMYHKDSRAVSVKELYQFYFDNDQKNMQRLEKWCLENYETLQPAKYFRAKDTVHKINPKTGKKYKSTVNRGDDIYFVESLYINEVCYLRSEEDSKMGVHKAILKNDLSQIEFTPLKKIKRLKTKQNVRKINPRSGIESTIEIESGREIEFIDTITVDGVQYLRTLRDSRGNRNLAIPVDALVKI